MNEQAANIKMVSKLLFRLLPVQILLCAVGVVNGIVSSYFASNFVGIEAMSAVGLYSPVGMLAVISVSVGEEDQQTLTDVMRILFRTANTDI